MSGVAGQPTRRGGSIADVEHVVIPMQENRSFDHYFGTLRGARLWFRSRLLTFGSSSYASTSADRSVTSR
jgi:phospholipase C